MKRQRKVIYGVLACIAMVVIILDGNCAVNSVRNGIDLCLGIVIPALLPFFVLSGIVNRCFLGQNFRFLAPIQRLCKIPKGTESILFIGLLSGYPVGAQLIADAYANGNISKDDAKRMLGFCSNAGPAFIFGMLATTFTNPLAPWMLWGIHIASALLVGWALPGTAIGTCALRKNESVSVVKSLHNAIGNIVMVCGWVIIFRLILDFCNRWFLWLFPVEVQILFAGAIELTNGCVMLQQLESECMRFIFAATILAFGGQCVAMQTLSVTKKLGVGSYFLGKLLQMLLSVTLCTILCPLIYSRDVNIRLPKTFIISLIFFTVLIIYLLRRKKVVAFRETMMYNDDNQCY